MASMHHLEDVMAALDHPSSRNDPELQRKFLRLVRELRVRNSQDVAVHGAALLRNTAARLSEEERLLTMEQVCMAALDCRAMPLARSILDTLKHRFPNSQRAGRLAAMSFEAQGKYEDAAAVVKALLEEAPDNQALLKRKVAVAKGRGDVGGAIDALRKYLDTFQTDREAWEEMAELCLRAQRYPQAALCYEELLLGAPASAALHAALADTLYTMGGAANLASARAYYAAALQLSRGASLRALLGLCACAAHGAGPKACVNSASSPLTGFQARGDKKDEDLGRLCARKVLRHYEEASPGKLPYVRHLLKSQGLLADAAGGS